MEYKIVNIDGIDMEIVDVRVGDKIFVSFDDRYDEDFAEWCDEYVGDLIVTEVDYEQGMVWLKDCPYGVDMSIINDAIR